MNCFLLNIVIAFILFSSTFLYNCQNGVILIPLDKPWSERIADSYLLRHPNAMTYDSVFTNEKWNYEQGLMLISLFEMWKHTKVKKYYDFVEKNLNAYIDDNGVIKTYKMQDYNLDNILPGKAVLFLYEATKKSKFKYVADTLRKQLLNQPRNEKGGFWHKQIYPNQMWLDGLFMAEPFYGRYATLFNDVKAFDDIAHQFILIYQHVYDEKTGLLFHGWDESKQQKWADTITGCSPSFWSRSMGWYMMGLVDVLDDFPVDHRRRSELIDILRNISSSILKYRDETSGLWYQVTDQGEKEGNYLEASASCMFTYCFAKGANKGYLDKKYFGEAEKSFEGIIKNFIKVEKNGLVTLRETCRSAGLGGSPYRDGSFKYYVSEPRQINDMKGIGPFLLAAIEIEKGRRS